MDIKNTTPVPLEPHRGKGAIQLGPAAYREQGLESAAYIAFTLPDGKEVTIARNANYRSEDGPGEGRQPNYGYTVFYKDEVAGYMESAAAERFVALHSGTVQEIEDGIEGGYVSPVTARKYRGMVDSYYGLAEKSVKPEKRKAGADTPQGPGGNGKKNEFGIWGDRAVITKERGSYWLELIGPERKKLLVLDWEAANADSLPQEEKRTNIRTNLELHERLFNSVTPALYSALYSGKGIADALGQYMTARQLYREFRAKLQERDVTRPSGIAPAIPH